jgi:hypothetical protein
MLDMLGTPEQAHETGFGAAMLSFDQATMSRLNTITAQTRVEEPL